MSLVEQWATPEELRHARNLIAEAAVHADADGVAPERVLVAVIDDDAWEMVVRALQPQDVPQAVRDLVEKAIRAAGGGRAYVLIVGCAAEVGITVQLDGRAWPGIGGDA